MVVLALVAAGVAALGSTAPTGIAAVDALYLAAAGATLTFAGGRSRRYTWIVSALVALWIAPSLVGKLLAVVAIGIGAWSVRTGRRRWAGAAVGLVLVVVLGDLGAGPFLGSTTLLAAASAAPMLTSALIHVPVGRQRTIVGAISLAGAAAVVATVVFVGVVALTVDDVDKGVEAAQAAFAAASDGDGAAASSLFEVAADRFDDARGLVGGPWSLPARLVPLVGQHVRATQVVASEGTSLARVAADTADEVDPDEVRIVDGRVDLSLVDSLAPTLDRVDRSLTRALDRIGDVQNPWLVGPIEARLSELLIELDAAVPAARTASLAARHVPEMLGSGGPVGWLVLLTTPAEARGLGGLVGSYMVVRADDGRIEITESGRNEDLNASLRAGDARLDGPAHFVDRWGADTARFFQDVTLSPDLPTVATVAADLFAQAMGSTMDGVVVVDPASIGAILALTGPVQVGDLRLDSSSVVDFLLEDQYVRFDGDEDGRVAALDQLVRATFDSFLDGALPGPRGLADALGPLIDQDRIGVWWMQEGGPGELIDAAGLDGRFPRPDGGDLLAVVHQNAGQNKLDVHLDRTIVYRAEKRGDRVTATAEITLHNRAPSSGLPASVIGSNDQGYPPGTNVANVAVHTALDLVAARLDGEPIDVGRALVFDGEALSVIVEIPAGGRRVLEVDVAGTIGSGRYRLHLPHQPLVTTDRVTVEVGGDLAASDGAPAVLLDDHRLTQDLVVEVD